MKSLGQVTWDLRDGSASKKNSKMCAGKKAGLNLLAGQRDKLKDPFAGNFSRKFHPHLLISQGKRGHKLACCHFLSIQL